MGRLDTQVALVTGSTSGIGAATARALAAEGAMVVVNSIHSVADGMALAEELGGYYVQADVSLEADALRLVNETLEFGGRLDVLVNNAGTTRVIPFPDLDAVTDEDWQRILGVNVIGTWYVTRAAVPALRRTRGCVVNITSIAGLRAIGSSIPYGVSKAGLNHLTRQLAHALGPEIRVNAVAPGLVDTPWTADWDEVRAQVEQTAPLHRSGRPEDIAAAVLGLVFAPYTTGTILVADGGLTL